MINAVEALWPRLHTVLAAFSEKLAALDPMLIISLGCTASDAFLLRGYLAFKRHAVGDEVAITIDVQSDGRQLTIDSDACSDGGRVIAAGPAVAIPLPGSKVTVQAGLDDWLRDFERFLQENESVILRATSHLT